MNTGEYVRRLLILAVFLIIGMALYRISGLLPIFFASIMFALIFSSAASALTSRTRVPRALALVVVVVTLLLVITGLSVLFGQRISVQIQQLSTVLPSGFDHLRVMLKNTSWGPKLIDEVRNADLTAAGGNIVSHAVGAVGSVFSVVADIVLIFFGAIYLAAQPDLYVRGMLKLLPLEIRPRGAEVLSAIRNKLLHWLLGQFISMIAVGTAFGVALAVIGVPSSIVLGLIAALLEFIPMIGPMLAAVPALLVALPQGGSTVLSVVIAFVIIQQIESNVLVPYVQKRAVELPPVVALFSTVIFGLLFGVLGLIFAVPLVVMLMIAVQEIYVHDILGDRIKPARP